MRNLLNKYWLKFSFMVFILIILLLGSHTYDQRSDVGLDIFLKNGNTSYDVNILSSSVNTFRTTNFELNGDPQINVFDCSGVSGTTITGLNLVNTSLYVLNCPQSIVRENIISSSINPDNSSLGIKIFNSPGSLIRGNEISDIYSNNISNTSVGILLIDSDDTIIEKNTIFNVTGTSSPIINFPLTNGIFIDNSSNVTISYNEILSINGGYVNGIYANGTGEIVVDNNLIDDINGFSGITAGILIETYDYAELTSNIITNLNTVNSVSSPRIQMTIGISTFMLYGNDYVHKTLIQANILENISIVNNIGPVDLIGIGSFSDEDTISQNTITNLTIVGKPNVDGLLGAVASLSPTFINGNSTITDNIVSDLYIGDTLSNGSMFGFYTSNRYSVNIQNNQLSNVNNSAFFAGGGQTKLYYHNTILNLNFTNNFVNQVTSSYLVSEVHLKINENYGAELYSTNLEFTTNNRLEIVIEQPLIMSGYDSYEISRNGVATEVGAYDSSQLLIINASLLEVGVHLYKISYLDTIGNNPTFLYETNITVNPEIPITLDDLTDFTAEQGSSNSVLWNVITSSTYNYQILINGTESENVINAAGSQISYEIPNNLAVGIYNVTIVVENQDLALLDYFFINIVDTTIPTLSLIEDLVLGESINQTSISWVAFDLNPSKYSILIGNQTLKTGEWMNSVNITVEFGNLTIGNYTLTIFVEDDFGNKIYDEIIVSVRDITAPSISNPGDIFMNEAETGKYITWTVFDEHPANFSVGVNGIMEINDIWNGEVWIRFDLDGLDWGFYNISLTVTDITGNESPDWVFVRVYNQITTSEVIDDEEPLLPVDSRILVGAGIVVGVAVVGYGFTRRRG